MHHHVWQVTLHCYNWSVELGLTLNRQLEQLLKWQNARAHVVHCLLNQKMGLFHHYCFSDTPSHDHAKQVSVVVVRRWWFGCASGECKSQTATLWELVSGLSGFMLSWHTLKYTVYIFTFMKYEQFPYPFFWFL